MHHDDISEAADAAGPASPRPNIILIMADQWAAGSVGCYGCDVPDVSPGLDGLARDGVRFTRHYANSPMCGPSRATIFTGRSPAVHGILSNGLELNGDTPLFTQLLRSAGYRTRGVGKFHFTSLQQYPPSDLSHLGFDEVQVTEDPKHGPWLEWIKHEHPDYYERALAMSWPMPYIEDYPPLGHNLRQAWQSAYDTWMQPRTKPPFRRIFYRSPLPAELHQTAWITDQAIEALERERRSPQEDYRPFFLFVSYVDPHDPYDPPEPYADLFDWRQLPPPVPQEWSRDYCAWEYAEFQDTRFELSSFDHETWARLRALFYGSCRFVDDQIGRLVAHLHRTGLDRSTVIIFTTDHGDLIGDHGLLMKGPWHYDRTIRCPLIVRGPGVAPGRESSQLTCTLDLAPTVLSMAGVMTDVPLEGRKLPLTSVELESFEGHAEIALETNGSYVSPRGQCRSLVTADGWRLTVFPGQRYGELFDLAGDPAEQRNLYRERSAQARRLDLTERLVGAVARQTFPLPLRNRAEGVEY